eukprot:Nk52_evm14s2657 gene=Nk52_evmTU14s2657
MDPQRVIQLLAETFNADPSARKQAEASLDSLAFQRGFGLFMLQILGAQEEMNTSIRQAAAIYLKNYISKYWRHAEISDEEMQENNRLGVDPKLSFFINAEDKSTIRLHILDALVNSPEVVRSQMTVALGTIVKCDFPERWPNFVDKIVNLLGSGNQKAIFAALIAFRELAKKYQYKPTEEKQHMNSAVEIVMPIVYNVLVELMKYDNTDEVASMQKMCLKIYYGIIQQDIPAELLSNDQFPKWMEILLTIVDRKVPDYVATTCNNDEEEMANSPWWKVKKWALHILHRVYSRFGCPGSVIEAHKEFANYFSNNFAKVVLEVVFKQFSLKLQGQYMSPRVLQMLLNYCLTAVNQSLTWKIIKPHCDTLIQQIIFPLLCYSDKDDELWHEDPFEFVRIKFDIFEDFQSPVTAAGNLLKELVDRRGKVTLMPTLTFANGVLTEYINLPENQRNPRLKDGILNLIGNIAGCINKKKELKGQLENMLVAHVLPEFQSRFGFLRARACYIVHSFSMVKYKNDQNIVACLENVVRCMRDTDIPVRVEAAMALRVLIRYDVGCDSLKPVLRDVLVELIKLTNETENDDLTMVLQDLLMRYENDILPFGVEICQHLCHTFQTLIVDDDGDEDSNKSMTAMGVLSTIQTLVRTFVKTPESLAQLEPVLLPMIAYCLEKGILDFLEETYELLTTLTFYCPVISQDMWRMFGLIHHSFMSDASDFLPDLVPVLDNYMGRGTEVFFSDKTYVECVYTICEHTVNNEDNGEIDLGSVCELAELVMVNGKGKVDEYIPKFIGLIFGFIVKNDFKTQRFRVLCHEVVINAFYYNAPLTFQILESYQIPAEFVASPNDPTQSSATARFISQWFKILDKFTRVHDKKIAILALCSIMKVPYASLPPTVQAGWSQILLILIEIFSSLQGAYQRREECKREVETDDEDEEWDESEDFEDDTYELDEDEDFDDEEGKEYLRQLENYNFYDGLDSDDELEELLDDEDPLQNVDEYVVFRDTFQSLPSFDQNSYQVLSAGLKHNQVDAINEIIAAATNRESLRESEKIKKQGGFSFGSNTTVPSSFKFS